MDSPSRLSSGSKAHEWLLKGTVSKATSPRDVRSLSPTPQRSLLRNSGISLAQARAIRQAYPDTDLYSILGVSRQASDTQIRIAYFRTGRQVLKEKSENFRGQFQAISYCYEILTQHRNIYNRRGLPQSNPVAVSWNESVEELVFERHPDEQVVPDANDKYQLVLEDLKKAERAVLEMEEQQQQQERESSSGLSKHLAQLDQWAALVDTGVEQVENHFEQHWDGIVSFLSNDKEESRADSGHYADTEVSSEKEHRLSNRSKAVVRDEAKAVAPKQLFPPQDESVNEPIQQQQQQQQPPLGIHARNVRDLLLAPTPDTPMVAAEKPAKSNSNNKEQEEESSFPEEWPQDESFDTCRTVEEARDAHGFPVSEDSFAKPFADFSIADSSFTDKEPTTVSSMTPPNRNVSRQALLDSLLGGLPDKTDVNNNNNNNLNDTQTLLLQQGNSSPCPDSFLTCLGTYMAQLGEEVSAWSTTVAGNLLQAHETIMEVGNIEDQRWEQNDDHVEDRVIVRTNTIWKKCKWNYY